MGPLNIYMNGVPGEMEEVRSDEAGVEQLNTYRNRAQAETEEVQYDEVGDQEARCGGVR